jgi:predicted aspartyl protease
MAHVSFPIARAGLIVPVLVGLNGEALNELLTSGKPLIPPVPTQGLLDTGTDITAVSPSVLQRLGILSHSAAETHTAGGRIKTRLYSVGLSITDQGSAASTPWLAVPDLVVMELPTSLPDVEVLIGLDVLLTGRLEIDGPAGQFTLVF